MTLPKQTTVMAMSFTLAAMTLQIACNKQETAPPVSETTPAPAGSPKATESARPPVTGPALPATTPPKPPRRDVVIAEGTRIKVRTTGALSTKTHQAGDTFVANLEEPLLESGRVIASKGARVEGRITEADKGGRVKGRARLEIALTRIHTSDGQALEISTNTVAREAQGSKKEDAAKIGIGSGVGAAIGAIAGGGKGAAIGAATGAGAGTGVVLATRGDAATFPSETVVSFELRSPVTVR